MIHTIGIDVGSGAIKSVLFRHDEGQPQWLAKRCERIRSRDPMTLAREGFEGVLADAGLSEDDIAGASFLEETGRWARSEGPAPYPLAEACQDHLLALAIEESARTGADVRVGREVWA